MYNLYSLNDIKKLALKHNFSFSKSLGQNFLINQGICRKIVDLSGIDNDSEVIEIGPGFGVLTREIAEKAKKVVSIEIDKRVIPVLDDTLKGYSNVEILNNDVLKLDLFDLISSKFQSNKIIVCSNLPYYISTPIIMKLFESRLYIKSVTCMIQKEVCKKICTEIGNKDSSSITFAVNYYSHPKFLFNVPRGNFVPRPNVDSGVIRLDIKEKLEHFVEDENHLFSIVRAGFNNKRKMLVNSLCNNLCIDKNKLIDIFNNLGLDLSIRAEKMSIEQFVSLSNEIKKQ